MSNEGTKKPPATPKPTNGTNIMRTLVFEKKPGQPPASIQKPASTQNPAENKKPAPTPKPSGGTVKKYTTDK